ncbi:sigma-70 family RNA polymerase sigma factor [Pedobacter aquatilis]|uniref:RNA polymerase sigma factor n=1 Tax=Pedobacter aquatilis TaxID=351343 RepID=UPI00292D6145|nr:sigma-70 family RNA polymerase sigma factor [Pedobacter aquatilis]
MLFNNKKTEDHFLDSAIRGEKNGVTYLLDTYRDMAYSIALRITGNVEDAEEVVQDGFLKAFTNLYRFRRASKFSTWLYRIIYTTALSKGSSKKTQSLDLEDDLKYSHYLVADDVSGHLIEADRKKFLGIAMQKLKPEDQLIITLHYAAEKTIVEISEILNLKSSAIKMRLLRSRQLLQAELKKLLGDEWKDL